MNSIQDTLLDEDAIEIIVDLDSKPNETNTILNHNSIFYKGLFGMILCILPGAIVGLVLIKISLEQAKKARRDIELNSEKYSQTSIRRVKKGQLFARIGLTLFIAEIIAIIIFIS
jgi:hypothetical protein